MNKRNLLNRILFTVFIVFLFASTGLVHEEAVVIKIIDGGRKKIFSEGEAKEIRKREEEIERKLNGLMNSIRGKKRDGIL